ncbi:MAG: hypothetical protein GY797_06115 [Deltaproteobacteria bacterium]|nr:hypothetical protein [Deltaproteobacteria bacterium]
MKFQDKMPPNNPNQRELESGAVIEVQKQPKLKLLQRPGAILSNPLNFGR